MALTVGEQELFDVAVAALPHWFSQDQRAMEFVGLAAKHMGAAKEQSDYWMARTLITQADGATATLPDWLNQHARDRNTSRQATETDPALQDRLRNVPEALTRQSLLAAAASIALAAGEPSTGLAMVELPRDQAFFGKQVFHQGIGGTFAGPVGTTMSFTPSVIPWSGAPYSGIVSPNGRILKREITFLGSPSPANDGTFVTTGLLGDAVQYTNAAGVAEAAVSVGWKVDRYDIYDQPVTINGITGRDDAYFSRGYRMGRTGRGPTVIIILPYGCSEPTRRSVAEMLRQKKGAGIFSVAECRVNP